MTRTNHSTRRQFLKQTAGLGAAALAFPTIIPASALGKGGAVAPSERIVMGGIGTGGARAGHLDAFTSDKGVQMVAVCDADANHLAAGVGVVNEKYGDEECAGYRDIGEMLAHKDVDAVFVATPDHWHALASVKAFEAGKDVYCEKPLANSIYEGRRMIDAMTKHGRVLQTGSQERSGSNARYAAELVRSGAVGKLRRMVVNLPFTDPHHAKTQKYRGVPDEQPIPATLDWDRWLGHTPLVPYHRDRRHFMWRFILAYGGGEMTDRGAHVIDIGQLANNSDDTGPVEIEAKGRQIEGSLYDAFWDYEFTNTYANGVKMVGTAKGPRGVKFEGDDGWIFVHIHGGKLEASDPKLIDQKILRNHDARKLLADRFGDKAVDLGRNRGHHEDFLDAVRSRKQPMAGGEIGHRTATICHLNNIAMALGRKLKWDPRAEQFVGDAEANKLVKPLMREPYAL